MKDLDLLLIGPRPPPPTGQSIAFEMLIEDLGPEATTKVIDLAERHGWRDAAFSGRRALSILQVSWGVWRHAGRSRIVYLQMAQSRWGFLRDTLIIALVWSRRRPVVAHLHGGGYHDFFARQPPFVRWLIQRVLKRLDRVIVLSDQLHDNFAFMGHEFAERLRTVANACPVAVGKPKTGPADEVRLLYLSNLLVEKGYLDCIDALAYLKRILPDTPVRLTLAGAPLLGTDEYRSTDELLSTLKKRARYLGLADQLTVAGLIEGREKLRLLDDSHIALLPTYYRNEGQPLALIEAMARGLPIVATAWRGIPEMMESREIGVVVPAKSPIAIAEAVADICRNKEHYEELSANAVEQAAHYAREENIERMITVFGEVAEVARLPA